MRGYNDDKYHYNWNKKIATNLFIYSLICFINLIALIVNFVIFYEYINEGILLFIFMA